MKQKNLIVLGLVTALVVVAVVFVQRDTEASRTSERGQPVFAGLLDRINEASRIEVDTGADQLVVVRQGEDWTLESTGGYPVDFQKVKEGLMSLADLERFAPKTGDPARFSEIGVADPAEDPDGESMRVQVQDDGGQTLAELVVGTKKPGRNPQVYVHVTDEERAWLASGSVDFPTAPREWMDTLIANLGADRIRSVTVRHADGGDLTISKAAPTDANYTVEDVPEGRELTSETIASSLASGMSHLNLDDVRPEVELDFSSPLATAEFVTWGGLVVQAETVADGESKWVRFQARYEAPPASPEADAEGDAEDAAAADGAGSDAAAGEDGRPDEEAVRAEVASLNETFAGWAFQLPSWKQTNLEKRIDSLLRAEAPPATDTPSLPDDGGLPFDPFAIDEDDELGAPAELELGSEEPETSPVEAPTSDDETSEGTSADDPSQDDPSQDDTGGR